MKNTNDPMHGNLGNIQYSIHLIGKDCMQLSFETRSNDYKIDYVNPITTRIEVNARKLSEIKDFANGVYKAVRILISYNEKAEKIAKVLDKKNSDAEGGVKSKNPETPAESSYANTGKL